MTSVGCITQSLFSVTKTSPKSMQNINMYYVYMFVIQCILLFQRFINYYELLY